MKKPNYLNIILALVSLTAYLVVSLKNGLGVTDDSVNFLSAAISFPPELKKLDGSPFVEWTPLYPIILSFYKLANLQLLQFVAILHGIVYLISNYLIFQIISTQIVSRPVRVISRIIFIFSTPLLLIHLFIWTEPLFNIFLILAIICAHRHLQKNDRTSIYLLTIFSVLMCLQRKSGILFTFPIFITLVALLKHGKPEKRILKALLYFFISSSPFFVYLFIRKSVTDNYFTKALFQPQRFITVLQETFHILSTWLLPDEIPLGIRAIIIFSLFILFVILTRYSIRFTRIKLQVYESLLLVIFLTYILAIIIGFLFVSLDQPFDDRIFATVYIPGILLFSFLLDSVYKKIALLPVAHPAAIRKIVLVLFSLWLVYPVSRTIANAWIWYTNGPGGYNHITWKNNSNIRYLSNHSSDSLWVKTDNKFPLVYFLSVEQEKKITFANENSGKNYLLVIFSDSIVSRKKWQKLTENGTGGVYINKSEIQIRKK